MSKSSFVTDLSVSPQGGRIWKVTTPFTYERWCRGSRDRITVPMGFLTDFASIPLWRFLFWWLPMWAKYNKAAVLHDWLYQTHSWRYLNLNKGGFEAITRKEADYIFYEAMLVAFRHHRSRRVVARLEYWAVRCFGWMAYRGELS